MPSEELLQTLIQDVYDAAVNRAGWGTFITAFANALESSHAGFFSADTLSGDGSIASPALFDDDKYLRAYREYYVQRNVWIQGARLFLQPGRVRSSDQMCPRQKFLRSEWYADFCRPLGWTRGIAATIRQEGTTTVNIGAFRGGNRSEFTEEDFAVLRELVPHLERGLTVQRRLSESRGQEEVLQAILHRLATPALLVAQDGTVLFMNDAAESLVRASDGLVIACGKLSALLADDRASLSALIGGAAQTSARAGRWSGGHLRISRPYGRRALEVLISPLPEPQDDWFVKRPPLAAVFVTDPSQAQSAEVSALFERYGLTAAEAAVVIAVSRALSGKQICRELGISYNTLKTHLKHIYAKTQTRRQTELVRIFSGGGSPALPQRVGA